MGKLVAVTFYAGLKQDSHVVDYLNQPEVSVSWVPALVNIQQRNIHDLMTLANISPSAWRKHLIAHYDFDVLAPTPEGLGRAEVSIGRIDFAMEMANAQKENWTIQDDIDDLWSYDPDRPANISPAQIYEVLSETGARGTPVIFFQADEDDILAALAEDNIVTVQGANGVFVGLSDPINGYNWSPENLTGQVTFRPSAGGLTVIGDDHLLEYASEDAYVADVSFAAAPEERISSRSEKTSRLNPPPVRDLRPEAPAAGKMQP